MIDLHIHTDRSDGMKSLDEIIEEAKAKELKTIAITDHDVLHGACTIAGIKILAGVEMTAVRNGGIFHILGYHFDPEHPAIVEVTHKNLLAMTESNLLRDALFMEAYSRQVDYDRDAYEVFPESAEPVPGKQFISKAQRFLNSQGQCGDRRDFFRRLLPKYLPHWSRSFPKFQNPEAVIDAIHRAGGLAVLAHPFKPEIKMELHNTLGFMTELGVNGFECFHPLASEAISHTCLHWCKGKDLYITGGSDYHGGLVGRRLGSVGENANYITLPL